MEIRLLVFDFDGLIMDTETPDYQSWEEIFVDHGTTLPMSEWARAVGVKTDGRFPAQYLEDVLGRPLDHDALVDRRMARFHEMIDSTGLLPGVLELVEEAKAAGLYVAVASSADRPWVHGHLEKQGLFDRFDVIRTAEDVVTPKPAPDLYQAVLDALDVRPSEAIGFEDSPPGMSAVKAAGMHGVAVPNSVTRHYDLSHADAILDTLAGVTLERLRSILGNGTE